MEASMAVEVVTKNKTFNEENVEVSVLIADDDSSTIAAVRRESTHSIEKWSDYNHASKNFVKALHGIKPKLSQRVIDHLDFMFGIAVKSNKDNPNDVKEALLSVVPHCFDDHSSCGSWCSPSGDKAYEHKYLPHKKTGEVLKENLLNVFKRFADAASRLEPLGPSQANEAFNNEQ